VEVSFETRKLAKILNSEGETIREFGAKLGKAIMKRLAFLEAANCLEDVPIARPYRRHQLSQNRKGQFAVDLEHPYRLIFKPNHNPIPVKADGGLDLKKITAITILEMEDYH
jgi:proteic killer suppression protein